MSKRLEANEEPIAKVNSGSHVLEVDEEDDKWSINESELSQAKSRLGTCSKYY
jgi:hypothetical protein